MEGHLRVSLFKFPSVAMIKPFDQKQLKGEKSLFQLRLPGNCLRWRKVRAGSQGTGLEVGLHLFEGALPPTRELTHSQGSTAETVEDAAG